MTTVAATKPHSYTVVFPATGDEKLSDDSAVLDAEIEALEARLIVLKAAKQKGPKQEFPKWVYKPVETDAVTTPVPHCEKRIVNSEEELKALEGDWKDSPDPNAGADGKGATAYAGDGTVSDVTAHVATMTDVDALKALKAQERKGKGRQGVYDAIDARIAELKEQS